MPLITQSLCQMQSPWNVVPCRDLGSISSVPPLPGMPMRNIASTTLPRMEIPLACKTLQGKGALG